MSVIALLNLATEEKCPIQGVSTDEARDALTTIEYFPIAIGALKTLIKHPGHLEAKAHAERVIAHHDKTHKKAAPEPDLSDLG